MFRNMKDKCHGFSLLELVVCLFLISVLMAFAYNELEAMSEDVERVSFEGIYSEVQAQLSLKVAFWYARQEAKSRHDLKTVNPVTFMDQKPSKYAGELSYNALVRADPEHWYFVKDKQWLVYKAKRFERLENEFELVEVIPFEIKVSFNQPHQENGLITEARLEPVQSFKWRKE